MISDKELKEKFDKPNLESQKWDDEFLALQRGNDILKLITHMQSAKWMSINEAYICAYIKKCTLAGVSQSVIKDYLTKLINFNYIDTFAIQNSNKLDENKNPIPEYIITDKDNFNIIFKKLTDCYPLLKQTNPKLETLDRQGNCHLDSVLLSRYRLNFPHQVVTGYTHNFSEKSRYLHTWIEFVDENNLEQVIDYTMNAIINKSGYYKTMNVEPETLIKISGENIKSELDSIYDHPKTKKMDIRKYLLFREDVLNEISPQPQ